MTPRAPDDIRAEMIDLAERTRKLQAELAAALNKSPHNAAFRWKGAVLDALRADYESKSDPLRKIGRRHHTSAGCIVRLAKLHGWKRPA